MGRRAVIRVVILVLVPSGADRQVARRIMGTLEARPLVWGRAGVHNRRKPRCSGGPLPKSRTSDLRVLPAKGVWGSLMRLTQVNARKTVVTVVWGSPMRPLPLAGLQKYQGVLVAHLVRLRCEERSRSNQLCPSHTSGFPMTLVGDRHWHESDELRARIRYGSYGPQSTGWKLGIAWRRRLCRLCH